MSNTLSSYNGGSTMLEVAFPPISGVSPTSYFCGNLIWRQLVQQQQPKNVKSPVVENSTEVPPVFINATQYSQLHVLASQGNVTSYLEQCSPNDINKRDHKGNTPIIWASLQKEEETVQLLLDNNAAVNAQNFAGETALFLSASFGYDNIVTLLLESGASPSICNVDGVSPVHMAAAAGNITTLEILAHNGAFFNCQDDCGDTPLHYAIRECQLKTIEFLVARCNTSVDICNEDQESPIELASCLGMNDQVIQFLSKFSQGSAYKMDTSMEEAICY